MLKEYGFPIAFGILLVLLLTGGYGYTQRHRLRYEKQRMLVLAAQNGDLYRMRLMLALGADVNAVVPVSKLGSTEVVPLEVAAEHGQEQAVKLLLQHGADPNATGCQNPLSLALWKGHRSVAKLLLQNKADPFFVYASMCVFVDTIEYSPIYDRVREGDVEGLDWLLKQGVQHDPRTVGLLYVAVQHNQPKIMRFLLEKGIEPDTQHRKAWAFFSHARWKGNEEIIQMLAPYEKKVTYYPNKRTPQ